MVHRLHMFGRYSDSFTTSESVVYVYRDKSETKSQSQHLGQPADLLKSHYLKSHATIK